VDISDEQFRDELRWVIERLLALSARAGVGTPREIIEGWREAGVIPHHAELILRALK
jgi:hypothetical protein